MRGVEWAFVWMMVGLKIPIAALFWLVWWATRPAPDPEQDLADGDGRDGGNHPRPRRPHPPRRGPHAEPPPASPARVRACAREATPSR